MPVDEDEFETVKEILFTVARLQEGTSATLDRVVTNLDTLTFRVDGLASSVSALSDRVDRLVTENELDRQQAAQDRAQVRSLVEALTQRFSSNGHS